MIQILKELILDAQAAAGDTGVPRRLRMRALSGKATVLIGVRRSGKSTFMLQIREGLLRQGISPENILHLNFFDDRLHGLQPAQILEAYFALYPEKKDREQIHCFFDEIQALAGWEPFVDRLMRTELCAVYITGSSAQMLSRELATQMRGRALSWEMFPFSFRECLDAKGISHGRALGSRERLRVQHAFGTFWESGGFPEVQGLGASLRVRIHQEYFQSILFRDLVERHDIPHPRALKDLAHWLLNHIGSLYTVNSLTGYLKSLGHKVPKTSVSEYLAWLEDAYFLFSVRIYDASLARVNANPKKVYCIDHSLAVSVGSGVLVNAGHLLENLVFIALRSTTPEISYYRTRNGREVDFVLHRDRSLVQVCETLADPQTRKRELRALEEAMAELGQREAVIVTRGEEELLQLPAGTIRIMPAWRFLLELGDQAAG